MTEFPGFRDFGRIGAVGMLLCWVATYWTMPAILVVSERVRPIEFTPEDISGPASSVASLWKRLRDAWARTFGIPFAWVIDRAPAVRRWSSSASSSPSPVHGLLVRYVMTRPDGIRHEQPAERQEGPRGRGDEQEVRRRHHRLRRIGRDGDPRRPARTDPRAPQGALRAEGRRARGQEAVRRHPRALEDFVPAGPGRRKIPVLLAIKAKLLRARTLGLITDADWEDLERHLPPTPTFARSSQTISPPDIARAFTETDGTRGRIVYISPIDEKLTEDAHYLLRWADAYRETRLPDGSVVLGSGRAVIYADMWAAVIAAIPPAVTFSFLTTALVVLIAFRARRAGLLVLASLLVGIGWLGGLFAILHVRLNFLNFIALPITFGIGVDYAVNIVQRYLLEGKHGALRTVRETGGAVVLCSLTTTLGYLALVSSINFAVRSLGVAAVLGEVCCLLAAVLVLPAALLWWDAPRTRSRT